MSTRRDPIGDELLSIFGDAERDTRTGETRWLPVEQKTRATRATRGTRATRTRATRATRGTRGGR